MLGAGFFQRALCALGGPSANGGGLGARGFANAAEARVEAAAAAAPGGAEGPAASFPGSEGGAGMVGKSGRDGNSSSSGGSGSSFTGVRTQLQDPCSSSPSATGSAAKPGIPTTTAAAAAATVSPPATATAVATTGDPDVVGIPASSTSSGGSSSGDGGGGLGHLDSCLDTELPLVEIRKQLLLAGFKRPVAISKDAGRYVCNWTFYRSLQASRKVVGEVGGSGGGVRCYSLFVHMPREEVVGIEEQRRFAWLLLEVIDQLLTRSSSSTGTMRAPQFEGPN